MTGLIFGRLTVLRRGSNNKRRARWVCRCRCGNETLTDAGDMRRGSAISCGCSREEKLKRQGVAHPSWKGDKAGYWALHDRVEKVRGRPRFCEECKTTESKVFDWSWIHGSDPSCALNYRRLCRCCHVLYDGPHGEKQNVRFPRPKLKGLQVSSSKTRCPRGHSFTESNTYIWMGHRRCKECNRRRARIWAARKRAIL